MLKRLLARLVYLPDPTPQLDAPLARWQLRPAIPTPTHGDPRAELRDPCVHLDELLGDPVHLELVEQLDDGIAIYADLDGGGQPTVELVLHADALGLRVVPAALVVRVDPS